MYKRHEILFFSQWAMVDCQSEAEGLKMQFAMICEPMHIYGEIHSTVQ